MDVNQKAKELAYYIKGTREFKTMNKYKEELERNKSLKKHLDTYLNKIKYILDIKLMMLIKELQNLIKNILISLTILL